MGGIFANIASWCYSHRTKFYAFRTCYAHRIMLSIDDLCFLVVKHGTLFTGPRANDTVRYCRDALFAVQHVAEHVFGRMESCWGQSRLLILWETLGVVYGSRFRVLLIVQVVEFWCVELFGRRYLGYGNLFGKSLPCSLSSFEN